MEEVQKNELLLVQNLIYLNISEAALYLSIPETTFRKLVAQRYENIPFTKLGKRIIFKKDLLDNWIEKLISSNKFL